MTGGTGIRSVLTLSTPDLSPALSAYRHLFGAGATSAGWHRWLVGATLLMLREGRDQPRLLVPAADLVPASIATDAYADAQTLLARRSCPVLTTDPISGARTAVVDDAPVGIFEAAALEASGGGTSGEILGLDHVVMNCRSRDGALALFGAVLGFDFRLDHRLSLPAGGEVRQLFFRGAGAIVEVLVGEADGPTISLWGLAWTSADIDRSHTRLAAAGVELSPIRAGRKRGTRVFTIRGADLVVPTIVIGHGGKS